MGKIPGIDKAAILLTVLGEDLAAALLREMKSDEVKRILAAMGRVNKLDARVADDVLNEFQEALSNPATTLPTGGHDYVARVLGQAFSQDQASDFAEYLQQTSPQLTALEYADAEAIALVMKGQRLQTWAIVLASLDPERAAFLLQTYPQAQQAELLVRIARLGEVTAEAIEDLNDWLHEELKSAERRQALKLGGVEQVAAILSQMDSASEKRAVEELREKDYEAADQIEKFLFTFDDLKALNTKDMQTLMRMVDDKIWMVALRRCGDEVKSKVFAAMSERAAARMKDDIAVMKPVKVSDVESAQQAIIAKAKELAEKGDIVISSDEDTYV